MKPGKPTTFGILNKAMIFALPGNPVSSFVSATLFAMPALKILNGYLENYEY
jgi:molybdopterin biosynthesis enzyme